MREISKDGLNLKTELLKPQKVTTKDATKKKATHNYYRKWLIFLLPLLLKVAAP